MGNLDQFLTAFNLLHEAMKKYTKRDDNFGSLLYQLKEKHPVIKQYQDDIDMARELRNLLVHEKKETFNIAEPTTEFIDMLTTIRQQFENPTTVSIFSKEVISLSDTDSLLKVLELVEQYHVSQYPVFQGQRLLGILTDNGITNWLSSVRKEAPLDLTKYKVSELLSQDDKGASYEVVKQNMPLYEIEKKMIERINQKGQSKLVLLISKTGTIKQREDIIGIITPGDMPKVMEHL
ncbi:CBS domain-containing protein [Macrococcus brunensis]|uniref:CBS domain-containing protein n=1 Tax=Macrococcus brunensis TaxID=198483 RepID=UPI001EF102CB|nr:CBS domain-containing protein [Macrococcus brunensis]ULG74262.1 CBS domain-containing protein [Macrococcus brunensis]